MDPKPDTIEPMETYQITTRNHSRSLLNRTTTTTPKTPSRRAHYRKIIASTTTTTPPRCDDDDDDESAGSSTGTTPPPPPPPPSDAFTCGVCAQVLPSSPELERHVHATHPILFGSTMHATTDSDSDGEYARTRKSARKRRFENNNNNYSPVGEQNNNNNNNNKRKADCFRIESTDETLDGSDLLHRAKKRSKQNSINNNNNNNNDDDDDIEDGRAQKYHCPVCDREDFASLNVFETHLEDQHPEFEIKCASCNLGFKNHRVLNLHRFMVHHETTTTTSTPDAQPIIRGFKDLTFVDFSSGKFPTIARVACERDVREVSRDDGVRFECRLCRRAFPCAFSLDIHAKDCGERARRPHRNDDDDGGGGGGGGGETHRRDSFFAQLDLRNTSASENSDDGGVATTTTTATTTTPVLKLKEYLSVKPELGSLLVGDRTDTKDLADIQSIISVTSTGGLLQQLTASKGDPKDHDDETSAEKIGGVYSSHDSNSNVPSGGQGGDDEHQDDFAAEFRRMKLRGEFPCRLCTAVFPNLRALKGHNRAHLTGAGNVGPYRCNMCPHSSGDKAALVRHMRSHNGDRPYECSICNYAFTTKANCERHLRNRHAKVTRDEVKRSIIYHPSEDPTNEEIASKVYGEHGKPFKDEIPARLLYGTAETPPTTTPSSQQQQQQQPKASIGFVQPTPTPLETRFGLQIPDLNELRKYIPGLATPAAVQERPFDVPTPKCNLTALKEHRIVPKVPYDEALNLSNAHKEETSATPSTPIHPMPKIHVRRFDDLKRTSIESDDDDDDDDDKNGQTGSDDENGTTTTTTPVSRYRTEYRRRRDSDQDPIDLSMDVLDLSKKKPIGSPTRSDDGSRDDDPVQDQPKDLSKRRTVECTSGDASTPSLVYDRTRQFLLARQLLNGATAAPVPNTPVEFYANHLQSIYRNSLAGSPFAGLPTFGIGPYFRTPTHPFLTPTTSPLELHEMHDRLQKEIMRGLQLSGGGLIVGDQYGAQFKGEPKPTELKQQQQQQSTYGPKVDEPKPLDVVYGGDGPPCRTPATKAAESIIATTPNSVKMVIKNGVLMPKQKQRRYRTERPFSCEHCSARFTLRSNMERHIKQQHPQFWSQRQRSNVAGVPGRKPNMHVVVAAAAPPLQQQQQKMYFEHHGTRAGAQYEYYSKDVDSKEFPAEKFEQPTAISEQVKYAILAQQLKQAMRKDDVVVPDVVDEEVDENDALVIDEGSQSQESRHGGSGNGGSGGGNVGGGSGGGIDVDEDPAKKKTSTIEESMLKLKLIQRKLLEHERDTDGGGGGGGADGSSRRCDEEAQDLVPVSRLLDNASQIPFSEYFGETGGGGGDEEVAHSDDDEEEGLVSASGSASESGGNASGSDGNRSEPETRRAKQRAPDATPKTSASSTPAPQKKKSAYSLAPNRVTCPYCHRKFPWSSSLRRHVLTHTGQKPYKCPHCPLLFTTKSNCDRHLLRKHGNVKSVQPTSSSSSSAVATTTTTTAASSSHETKSDGGDASRQQQQQIKQQSTDSSAASTNFLMRNVPERPFKCSSCPSSTFSTLNNLKKHISFKHSGASSPGSPRSGDDGAQTRPGSSQYGYESHSSEDERCGVARRKNSSDWESGSTHQQHQQQHGDGHGHAGAPCNSELPFKCHLCDGSYAERQETLDHIREHHGAEYDLLVSKGALETTATTHQAHAGEQQQQHDATVDQHSDHDEHGVVGASTALMRGKFPDYANRKVICAFCMRRFWSAEDLRRHMRTHNGARPFSCDVCRRRFTLKHSMLRHRKKHNVNVAAAAAASDVEYATDRERVCVATATRDDDAVETDCTDGVASETTTRRRRSACDDVEQGSDLIGNLLGIRDRSIIDQVLVSSADDAAKLLGVDKTE